MEKKEQTKEQENWNFFCAKVEEYFYIIGHLLNLEGLSHLRPGYGYSFGSSMKTLDGKKWELKRLIDFCLGNIDVSAMSLGITPWRFYLESPGENGVIKNPIRCLEDITSWYNQFWLKAKRFKDFENRNVIIREQLYSEWAQWEEYKNSVQKERGYTAETQAQGAKTGGGKAIETPETSNEASKEYDVFLCHASEDKDSFVRPLAQALCDRGLKVWFDEFSLKLGDRLRESIEGGLNKSRYGVIVLSKDFFRKKWPQEELDGLLSLESREKKLLPIWHRVNEKEVKSYSPILATRVATETSKGLPYIVAKIIEVVKDS